MSDDAELVDLLRRTARRDVAAFTQLHLKVGRRVHAFIAYRVGEPALAEELLSDTMYAVWQGAARFAGESRVLTWILGIALNKVRMEIRGAAPASRMLEHSVAVDDVEDELAGDENADPLHHLQVSEQAERVRRCIHTLSAEHRDCLTLVFYLELSLAEVAALQGIPEGTVKTRLFHARQRVKDCFRRLYLGMRPASAPPPGTQPVDAPGARS